MNTARCVHRMCEYPRGGGIFIVEEGEIVEYVRQKNGDFIIRDVTIPSIYFFNHFVATDSEVRMTYSDFNWILINRVFPDGCMVCDDYKGHNAIIYPQWSGVIMLTVNSEETEIRVSFPDDQEKYSTYEEALNGIRNRKK